MKTLPEGNNAVLFSRLKYNKQLTKPFVFTSQASENVGNYIFKGTIKLLLIQYYCMGFLVQGIDYSITLMTRRVFVICSKS